MRRAKYLPKILQLSLNNPSTHRGSSTALRKEIFHIYWILFNFSTDWADFPSIQCQGSGWRQIQCSQRQGPWAKHLQKEASRNLSSSIHLINICFLFIWARSLRGTVKKLETHLLQSLKQSRERQVSRQCEKGLCWETTNSDNTWQVLENIAGSHYSSSQPKKFCSSLSSCWEIFGGKKEEWFTA